MKRIALLLCAVAILVGLLAPYTIAAMEAIIYDEDKDYVARLSGRINYAASEDNPICSYSRNNRILGVAYSNSGWGGTELLVNRRGNNWQKRKQQIVVLTLI